MVSNGTIELISTHIQRDQILDIPDDPAKKAALEELLTHARMVGTRGVVLDLSRLDEARIGSDEDHKLIDHIGDREDALIATTATNDADVLVTDDARFTSKLMSYPGNRCEVIDFSQFEKRLKNKSL